MSDNFSFAIDQLIRGIGNNDKNKLGKFIKTSDRIFMIGNGGSHAICDHIVTDLVKRCKKFAYALTSTPLITCLANDYGFENMYTEFLKIHNFGLQGDILIAISSSGMSKDITNPINYFVDIKNAHCALIGLCGMDGWPEKTAKCFDLNIHFNSYNYGEIEMATEVLLHGIVEEMVKEMKNE